MDATEFTERCLDQVSHLDPHNQLLTFLIQILDELAEVKVKLTMLEKK